MEKDVQSKTDVKRPVAPRLEIPAPEDEFFKQTDVHLPKKQTITIRLDADVLDWLRKQGRGYQTRINKLLRSYMKASMQRAG
jgi:uncharacterized protein (DUF4415 family)